MKAERIPIASLTDGNNGREYCIHLAEKILQGAIFVYPTETIYGIGGIGNLAQVKDKIIRAKDRPPEQSMILVASDLRFFSAYDLTFPPSAEALEEYFWPGMLTLIVPARNEANGIAIRVSDHPLISLLFEYIDRPIFSTSANKSGCPYKNDPDAIYSRFKYSVDFMIDAGPLQQSAPSTIVRVTEDDTVTVIREGVIPASEIECVLRKERN